MAHTHTHTHMAHTHIHTHTHTHIHTYTHTHTPWQSCRVIDLRTTDVNSRAVLNGGMGTGTRLKLLAPSQLEYSKYCAPGL